MAVETIQKRDGRMVIFDESKIADAIFKAAKAVGGADRSLAAELASVVTHFLQKRFEEMIPGIEDVQDLVEEHFQGRANRRLFIWSLLSFEMWCQRFLGGS